jgi:hypothetical protein
LFYPEENVYHSSNLKTPTKGILKSSDATNKRVQNKNHSPAKSEINSKWDQNALKVFSGSTRTISFYERRLFAEDKKGTNPIGSYLFELVGSLDSAITHDVESARYEFTVKDNFGRLHCVYFDMDNRRMEKIPRDCSIR